MSHDPVRSRLVRELWDRDERYYQMAREHVHDAAARPHEYAFLRRHLPPAGLMLEVGCGEGSNLEALAAPGRRFVGCDLSRLAVRLARGAAPAGGPCTFVCGAGEALPFPDATFAAVLGISLLEHLPAPERVVEEMIRVLAPEGILLLVSPQYGGPLGASPCRRGGGAGRFLRRLVAAHLGGREGLNWERVHPLVLEGVPYDGDRDTIIEPEFSSLRRFVAGRGVQIVEATSGLEWCSWRDYPGSKLQRAVRRACEALGRWGLPPYRDFGPLVAVAGRRAPA